MSILDRIINFFIFIALIGIIPICFLEYQYRDPTEPFIPKISLILIIIGLFIWYFSDEQNENKNKIEKPVYFKNNNYYSDNNSINYSNGESGNEDDDYEDGFYGPPVYGDNIYYNRNNINYNNKYINFGNKTFCNKINMQTYEQNKKNNTFLELSKLVQKKEFIDMASKKGENMNNWNWQYREKMKGN